MKGFDDQEYRHHPSKKVKYPYNTSNFFVIKNEATGKFSSECDFPDIK